MVGGDSEMISIVVLCVIDWALLFLSLKPIIPLCCLVEGISLVELDLHYALCT